ncbi:MAG TPA: hypothetical protein VLS89_03865 [Candidatus Nanopelagicales bacterium]|nr:hypothetical protein [Candidatus Nanopelagicales bacterium]
MALEAARDLALYFAFMLAATSVLSLPLAPATLLVVKTAPPLAVALVAGAAAAGAAVFDYFFIRRAFKLRVLLALREHRLFGKAERWASVTPFWMTVGFAALPLPYLFARVLVPLSGYPLPRYAAAVALGRFSRVLVIAMFGTVVDIPDWILFTLLGAGVAVSIVVAVTRQVRARAGARGVDPP